MSVTVFLKISVVSVYRSRHSNGTPPACSGAGWHTKQADFFQNFYQQHPVLKLQQRVHASHDQAPMGGGEKVVSLRHIYVHIHSYINVLEHIAIDFMHA
jgi:hypothetical protein